ncbi:uncharacterized protein LOC124532481 [Vanessa cardui]|uniref:uncharacterized protein LOC124532481 n=1 Tax=Vanessa cardui TaxID=171605 RepID=UPI001F13014D|nr:uncharacterized protein LOC124532481 [Vanessa cardui]
MNKIWSFGGLPNLWVDDVYNNNIYKYFHRFITVCLFMFVSLNIVTLFIHTSLSDKQSNDRLLFGFSHPILMTYYIGIEYHKVEMKNLLTKLCITLKSIYNDPDVEKRMIKRASYYSFVYTLSIIASLSSYGFDALMQIIYSDGSFITVVTAWPDIEDKSTSAALGRIVIYVIWWIFMIRVSAVMTLTIMTTVALSHQYKNLQSYFYSLNDIFQNENDQNEKEAEYVVALNVGVKLHSDTLWCTRQCQITCSSVISGQIAINVTVICLLMLQMMNSERTLVNALTILSTSIAVLASTGFLMWNAGDVTIDASLIPTAMYSSGWHHCRSPTSAGVRKLLVVAMTQGQKHVVLRSFGVVEISYQSFLSIVKSSYSAFSILVYNDPVIQMRMIKKSSYYTIAHFVTVSFAYVLPDGSFITVVTAWPDVEDNSTSANLMRLIIYIIWWFFMIRVTAAITITIMITISLSHQYKNLQSYFYSLNEIFQDHCDENDLNEKELKYVEALKVGIKLHSDTLWCTRQCQVTCSTVISGQILITVSVLCLLMLQMVNSERTLMNVFTIITTSSAVLTSSGFIMWNAGDITIEAALVPTAMFSSGWQHCRGSTSERVRKLLFVAMTQGQKHIFLRSYGIVEISYTSYVSIVKSSYSVFSFLY